MRTLAETVRMLRNPMWRGFCGDMRSFKRRDFHPDQIDTTWVS